MIPRVQKRGTRVGGLLRYLYGPGKREEHLNPRIVAAWDGAGELSRLEPPVGPSGQRDYRRLVELLEQPIRAGRNPPAQRRVAHVAAQPRTPTGSCPTSSGGTSRRR